MWLWNLEFKIELQLCYVSFLKSKQEFCSFFAIWLFFLSTTWGPSMPRRYLSWVGGNTVATHTKNAHLNVRVGHWWRISQFSFFQCPHITPLSEFHALPLSKQHLFWIIIKFIHMLQHFPVFQTLTFLHQFLLSKCHC